MADGKKIEADFLLWYQRKHPFGTVERTQVVFGEAKSYPSARAGWPGSI
jgi:hypothetical protein